eukprot:Lankesteria_metandrocarpae@DN5637_c0_g1_i1.p1
MQLLEQRNDWLALVGDQLSEDSDVSQLEHQTTAVGDNVELASGQQGVPNNGGVADAQRHLPASVPGVWPNSGSIALLAFGDTQHEHGAGPHDATSQVPLDTVVANNETDPCLFDSTSHSMIINNGNVANDNQCSDEFYQCAATFSEVKEKRDLVPSTLTWVNSEGHLGRSAAQTSAVSSLGGSSTTADSPSELPMTAVPTQGDHFAQTATLHTTTPAPLQPRMIATPGGHSVCAPTEQLLPPTAVHNSDCGVNTTIEHHQRHSNSSSGLSYTGNHGAAANNATTTVCTSTPNNGCALSAINEPSVSRILQHLSVDAGRDTSIDSDTAVFAQTSGTVLAGGLPIAIPHSAAPH